MIKITSQYSGLQVCAAFDIILNAGPWVKDSIIRDSHSVIGTEVTV